MTQQSSTFEIEDRSSRGDSPDQRRDHDRGKVKQIRSVKEEKLRTRLLWHFVAQRGVAHGDRRLTKKKNCGPRFCGKIQSRLRESGSGHMRARPLGSEGGRQIDWANPLGIRWCDPRFSLLTASESIRTSAVTANWKSVTHWNQAERMAIFGALRHSEELLSDPYRTRDLCPVNLCPRGGEPVTRRADF
jgi:hypothetical protein